MSHRTQKSHTTSLAVYLCIGALLAILIGKLVANDHDHDLILYSYGILVTAGISVLLLVRYWYYKDPYVTAHEIEEHSGTLFLQRPMASIMVAAYNEEVFIARCVESLREQTYGNREIIVVNDASTDNTRQVLQQFEHYPDVRIVNLKRNVGKKRALAQAMLRARGSIFLFTDSDSVLEPTAVEKIITIFNAQPDIGAVSGHTRAYNADDNILTHIQDTWYEGQFSIRKAYESVFGAVTCVSGPLAAFRREAIFNLIPLWTNDTFLGSEFKFATDRTKTALVLGNPHFSKVARERFPHSPFVTREQHNPQEWEVVYTRSAHAWTNVPTTVRSFLRQQIRWKKSFLRNIWLTGAFYWRKPLPAAAMYYLRALFVFVGPFIVFRHLVWLPMNGTTYTTILYLSGVLFIGVIFATLHKIEQPRDDVWVYRPLMNLISTFVLTWLIFYSLFTIRKMVWHRG